MNDTLKKAAMQELTESLGYDEARLYWSLLNKEDNGDFSHSKSYRLFKSLMKSGAVAKVNDVQNESSSSTYIPLPPSFRHHDFFTGDDIKNYLEKHNAVNKEVMEYLSEIYQKNYERMFKNAYLEFSMYFRNNIGFFLIEKFMKKYAITINGGADFYAICKKNLSQEKFNKIQFACRKDYSTIHGDNLTRVDPYIIGTRRALIIDGEILVEWLRLPQEHVIKTPEKTKHIGYLLSKKLVIDGAKVDIIKTVERELRQLIWDK